MQHVSIQATLFDNDMITCCGSVTNADSPRKPEGSLGRTAQDVNDMITCCGSVIGESAALVDEGKSICLFRRTEI